MPRRAHEDTSGGESDSFLDVVANMVGILIILIVIVGVRVGESTRATTKTLESSLQAEQSSPNPVAAPRPAPPNTPPAPDPQLLADVGRAKTAVDALSAKSEAAIAKGAQLAEAIDQLGEELAKVSSDQDHVSEELATAGRASEAALAKQKRLAEAAQSLQEKISDLPSEKVKTVRHELNPIAQSVHGDEVHFRLAHGRVSRIPLKTFIKQLQIHIQEKKELIARVGHHVGLLGPFDGYTMKYVIDRTPSTLAADLRFGPRMIRIQVTGWKVIPQETLHAETANQALQASSRFRQALRQAGYGTTLTFWVYPDSFAAYRQLKEFAQQRGFAVAARPLPSGVPIAGSPHGSHSRSQ